MKGIAKEDIAHSKLTSGTKEWADHNVNCIIGCMNDCRYCYAKLMARRFRRQTYENWSMMKVRESVTNKSFGEMSGRVMFPSSHDIVDVPDIKEACLNTLGKLLERNNEVLITTKPSFSVIKAIDSRYSKFKQNMQFRFTITSLDNKLLRFWEPNAPLFEERLKSLKYAFNKKYKTSVSIEPFLDRNPNALVKIVQPFCTESIWIGKMNYIPSNVTLSSDLHLLYSEVRHNYDDNHLLQIYNDLKKYPKIKFKDSVINKLSNRGLI